MTVRFDLRCAVALALLAAGCERSAPAPSSAPAGAVAPPPAAAATAAAVPDPDTASMEPRVIERVAEARARVVAAPTDADAWGAFGTVCYPHDLFEVAETAFAEAHRLAPTEFKWPYMLALTRDLRGGDPERMRAMFDEALRLRPDYVVGWVRRGDAFSRAGLVDEAIASLRTALERDESDPAALRRLGEILLQAGRTDEALPVLERAVKADPGSGGVWRSLALAYQRSGRAEQAAQAIERAQALEIVPFAPFDPVLDEVMAHGISSTLCLDRGERLLRAGRPREAFVLFKVCEEVHPDSSMVQTYLGLCLAAANQLDAAEIHFRKAIELAPTQYDALVGLADLLIARKDLASARALLERAIAADDARPRAHARLGLALAQEGRLPEALASFEAADARGPLIAADHYNWARALLDGNLPAEAGARLQKALRVDPKHVPTHYQLASLYEALGVNDRARWHYEMVLRLQPGNAKAAERLSKLPK